MGYNNSHVTETWPETTNPAEVLSALARCLARFLGSGKLPPVLDLLNWSVNNTGTQLEKSKCLTGWLVDFMAVFMAAFDEVSVSFHESTN